MKISVVGHVPEHLQKRYLPVFGHSVSAGFPSPAESYQEDSIDLNEHLVRRPAATFFGRASGDSMEGKGIYNGDLLVIDRSKNAVTGSVVIAAINGELVCKILDVENQRLLAANPRYSPIRLTEDMALVIEGVVTHSIRYHDVCSG